MNQQAELRKQQYIKFNLNIMNDTNIQAPPSAVQFEETVLGAIINEPEQLAEVVSTLDPDCFFDAVNGHIYSIIRDMYDRNEQIDLFTVSQKCNAIPELKQMKIAVKLAGLTQKVGSGAHLVSHAAIVKDQYVRRNMILSARQVLAKAYDDSEDVSDALEYFSKQADSANELAAGGAMAHHIGKSLSAALKQAEKRQVLAGAGKASGITTGLADLDRMTGGWQPAQLIVLAARPSMGKTALALHLAKAAACSGVPVCIYSLEMSDISLANRLLLSECKVEVDRFRTGNLDPNDWKELEAGAGRLEKLPIYVDDNPMASMRYIKAHSKIMQKRGKCGLILVDYLQLADTAADKKNRNREQEIAQASRQAKIVAKELGVPFILLSQLSRNVEGRADKLPVLSDLRESGAIEQDADIVSFIYRPAYYKQDRIDTRSHGNISTDGLGILSIAKQRDGATGMVLFQHNPAMTKIADYAPSGQTQPDHEPF